MTIFKRFLIFSWLCLGAGWLYAGACWGAGIENTSCRSLTSSFDTLPAVRKVLDTLINGRYNEIGKRLWSYTQVIPVDKRSLTDIKVLRIDQYDEAGNLKYAFDLEANNPIVAKQHPNMLGYMIPGYYALPDDYVVAPGNHSIAYEILTSNSGMPVAGYRQYVLDTFSQAIDVSFTALFLDENGQVADTMFLPLDIYEFSRSSDGRFFAVTCGGPNGPNGIKYREETFLLFDLEDKSLIYQVDGGDGAQLPLPFWNEEFQFFSIMKKEYKHKSYDRRIFYVVYPAERKVYKKSFDQRAGFYLGYWDKDGFYAKDNGKLVYYPFDAEFEMIKF